ncbi:hypothetical protein BOZ38_RS24470, partial [Escherichia coli]|nr:hypothetical protein [Escherichia coli]
MNCSCALMPDATLTRLIMPTTESQRIEFAHFDKPDQAFTPHPAFDTSIQGEMAKRIRPLIFMATPAVATLPLQ